MFLRSLIAALIVMGLTGGIIFLSTEPGDKNTAPIVPKAVEQTVPVKPTPQNLEPPKTLPQKQGRDISLEDFIQKKPSAQQKPSSGWQDLTDKAAAPGEKPKTLTRQLPVKSQPRTQLAARPKSIGKILNEGLEDARKLETVAERDAAFLEMVKRAVEGKAYSRGTTISEELSTPELRDAAKADVAVGLMRSGQLRRGQGVLSKVETQYAKDILENQVYESAEKISGKAFK